MKKLNPFSLVFITGAFIVSCSTDKEVVEKETPVSVTIATPVLETGDQVSVSGQLESRNTAVISTRMMGFISRIMVNPGDKVAKGQLLVVISSDDIQAKRAQAIAMISEAEAALCRMQRRTLFDLRSCTLRRVHQKKNLKTPCYGIVQ